MQGLTHDLSKYTPAEFIPGARYYQGDRSPQAREREVLGYSAAWLHHKGRNKHHYEYWSDHTPAKRGACEPIRMPRRYVAEMYCDRLAATHIYNKGHYNDRQPLDYYLGGKDDMPINPATKAELEKFLIMTYEKGEDITLEYIKKEYLKK